MVSTKKLIKQLKDEDEKERLEAILELGEKQDDKAVQPLIEVVQQDTVENRIAAIVALSEINDHRAIETLIYCLMDSDVKIRLAAARALGKFTSPQAISTLIVSLEKDPDINVKCRAALSLGGIGSPIPAEILYEQTQKKQVPPQLQYSINAALKMIADNNNFESVDELLQSIKQQKEKVEATDRDARPEEQRKELENVPRFYDYIRKYVFEQLDGIQTVLSVEKSVKEAEQKIVEILGEKFWNFVDFFGEKVGHKLTEYQSDLLWQFCWDTSRPIRNEIYTMIRDHRKEVEDLDRFQAFLSKVDIEKEQTAQMNDHQGIVKEATTTEKIPEEETAANRARAITGDLESIMQKYAYWGEKEKNKGEEIDFELD